MRGSHGGMAAQAKRRGEEYLACLTCGQPHARLHLTGGVEPPPERRTFRGYVIATLAILAFMAVVAQAGMPA